MNHYSKEKIDKLVKERNVDVLIEALQDRRTTIRSYAARAIANIKGKKSARAVERLLADPRREVVLSACEALGRIGESDSIPALIEKLGSDRKSIQNAAANSLTQMGKNAVSQLAVAMLDSRPQIRALIATILGNIGKPDVLKILIVSLEDNNKAVRRAAITALGRIGDSSSAEELTKMLGEFPDEASWSLERLGKSAIPHLLSTLHDRRKRVRASSAKALGRLRGKKAVGKLIDLMQDDSSIVVRRAAAWALGEIGDILAVIPLLRALTDIHESAAKALGKLDNKHAVSFLCKHLENDEEYFRSLAAWALGEIGNPQAIPALAKKLDDADPEVRRKVAVALARIGTPAALEILMVKDTPETRQAFKMEEVLGETPPPLADRKPKKWLEKWLEKS